MLSAKAMAEISPNTTVIAMLEMIPECAVSLLCCTLSSPPPSSARVGDVYLRNYQIDVMCYD